MLVVDQVADILLKNGIEKIYLYPGGTIAPIVDACLKVGIQYECFKSEQGAGYAALAVARITKRPQVVLVTSGPGVTNVISPLADAYYDSTPLILITGQISSLELQSRLSVRQRGFQETPTVSITSAISKKSVCLMDPASAISELNNAFKLTTSGRMGPVVLDFPMNIQRASIDKFFEVENNLSEASHSVEFLKGNEKDFFGYLNLSKRRVLYLGQGALIAERFNDYLKLAETMNAFVVCSFLGMGSFDTNHPRFLGYAGHTGHLAANKAVYDADLVVVLGSRLDVRQTGTKVDEYVPNGKVFWIDFDKNEISNPRIVPEWVVYGKIEAYLDRLLNQVGTTIYRSDKSWEDEILTVKSRSIEDVDMSKSDASIYPKAILKLLSKKIGSNPYTLVTGVGCHQHWAARHLPLFPNKQRFLSSGGHGTMGYDIPSAAGAALCLPDIPVLCVVGDGSALMNIQELASIVERKLNIKILIFNNRRLGIVSQFQQMNWGSDPTTGDFSEVQFAKIGTSFGIESQRLESMQRAQPTIDWFWNDNKCKILEVMLDPKADILPMLIAGQKMNEMWMGYQDE